MTKRFKFSHDATNYVVIGSYGVENKFIVTKLEPETEHKLGTSSLSALPVLALVIEIDKPEELRAKLDNKFPGLMGFEPF
jgi:hypothetical protein